MKIFMRDAGNTLADILLWLPLAPVPVFTPRLLHILELGVPTYPTQDSFVLLKRYAATLQLLAASETVWRRAPAAFAWLGQRVTDRVVDRSDVEGVAEHLTARKAAGDDAVTAILAASLLEKFDAGELTAAVVDEFVPFVETVARYTGAPWMANRVFADDIMEDHAAAGADLCVRVGADAEVVAAEGDAGARAPAALALLRGATQRFLRLYEASIMRLLQAASRIGDTVPQKFFGDLASPVDRVPASDVVHIAVRASVRRTREFISDVRSTATGGVSAVAHAAPDADDTGHDDCLPTVEELDAYLAFVGYHADDEDALAASVARMQIATHIAEPVEAVPGIAVVPDVDHGVPEDEDVDVVGV